LGVRRGENNPTQQHIFVTKLQPKFRNKKKAWRQRIEEAMAKEEDEEEKEED
jgi:hypothetical protein